MKCQIYVDNINAAPSPLHNLTSPWPFSMWGLNIIGPIKPKASNKHRFILVVIDYFTKWVEATSYPSVTKNVVVKFIKKDIICRYGLPAHIITDNGTNLNNKMMIELCEQFKIRHHNSTPYPLHGYHTSIQISTGATPYSLVYNIEAIPPIEVEIPSLRVLVEIKLEEVEWIQNQLDQLNLIKEKRLMALCHRQLYQKRIKNAFDKKARPRTFKEGDLVLKKILPNARDHRGKWMPNYKGPYVMKHALSRGALILTDADGRDLKHPINADSVKLFYP
ncbi:Pol polyprotein, partial [Mucuna pruriens]